jgi:hypothetical protein
MHAIAVIAAVLLILHLAGGVRAHRRRRRAGTGPRLYYSLGRGWYGPARLPGGFRAGRRLSGPPGRSQGAPRHRKGDTSWHFPS